MATFHQLVTRFVAESGAVGAAPSSVTGQSGRQALAVAWVRDAWVRIQNLHANWFFLQSEWEGQLVAGQASYTHGQLAFTDYQSQQPVVRFGQWIGDSGTHRPTRSYDPSIGVDDQQKLRQISWQRWRDAYDMGVGDEARPHEYCLAPDGTIRFGALPDKPYVIRGEYRKTPQYMTTNDEVPDLPERFHDAIIYRAIMLMAQHDEAIAALSMASTDFRELLTNMERDLLPQFNARAGRPIA